MTPASRTTANRAIDLLANHVTRTLRGPMWHGPALLELLDGVSAEHAAARPVAAAHSIWELVLHTAVWAEIARERVHGGYAGSPTSDGLVYSVRDLVYGVIEHGVYHGGQIALLTRALGTG
jgi:hypothetical protein